MYIAITIRFKALDRFWTLGNKEHDAAGVHVHTTGTLTVKRHARWLSSCIQTRDASQQAAHEAFLASLEDTED